MTAHCRQPFFFCMLRLTLAPLLAIGILAKANAQTPPAPPPSTKVVDAAAVQPPAPGTVMAATAPSVAPPAPGQIKSPTDSPPKAATAVGTSRIPDVPAPALTPVPSTPLSSGPKSIPSTSGSGQFIVHGQDARLKTAFSARCDEIKDELGRLLRDSQPWSLPIVVLLNAGENARNAPQAVSTSVAQITHGGFHLQITVNLRPDLRPSEFRGEVVRALMTERVLRSQPEVTSKRTALLPDWILTGVMEALDYRRQARPSTLFAAIFKSGKIFGIEEIIEASPTQMDALSKTIYRTSCCALVLALLDQPEGSARLNRFLSSLATDARPERELLNRAFPSFASSAASLNKWWALQLAGLAQPKYSEPLTAADTLKSLEDALTIRYQAKASEIPKPRPIAQPALASTEGNDAPNSSKPTPGPGQTVLQVGETTIITEAPPEEKEKAEPSFLRSFVARLNPFAKKRESNADIIESAIVQAAREEALSGQDEELTIVPATPLPEISTINTSGPRTAEPNTRKPLFNRWFGSSEDKSNQPDDTANSTETTSPAPAQTTPTATVPTEEATPANADKPSRWNPLNWFRQSKPQAKAPESAQRKPTATLAPSNFTFWQQSLHHGKIQAIILQQAAEPTAPAPASGETTPIVEPAPTPPPAAKKRGFLGGLFGSKKDKKTEEPAPAPAEPTTPAPAMNEGAAKSETTDTGEAKKTADKSAAGTETTKPASEKTTSGTAAVPPPTAAKDKKDAGPATEKPQSTPPPSTTDAPAGTAPMTATAEATPATEAAVPVAEPVPESRPTKRGPMRLKDLFGRGKKPPAPTEEPAPMPTDPAATQAPGMEPVPNETTETKPATPAKTESVAGAPKAKPSEEPKQTTASDNAPKAKATAKKDPPKETPKKREDSPKAATRAPEPAKPEPKATEPAPKATELAPAMTAAEKPAEKATDKPAEKPTPKPEPPKVTEKKKTEPKPQEPLVAAAVPIEDYSAIMKRPDRKQILDRNLAALRVLQVRCAILFRPIIGDYILLLTDLREDKAKNVDERLKKLRQRSLASVERSKAIRDLLDVHEANYSAAMSGLFDDYLSLPERIQEELPPRHDPISKYLDALDREFSKP